MATREEILGKIRGALVNDSVQPPLPEPPQVWPVQGKSADELLGEFETNLTAVAGEVCRCADRADAEATIAETLKSIQLNAGVKGDEKNFRLGFRGGELTDALLDGVLSRLEGMPVVVERAPEDAAAAKPDELESISASLIPAELLLADAGSAVVRSASAIDRLMNYISPVCLIAAKKSQLREHLPHAWPELTARLAGDAERTGEFLLMTGPSRTADIEKILILGLHGPKNVVVYIVENE